MSETPERIWAFAPDIFDNCSLWQDAPSPAGDTIEYVRADRIEELEAKLAVAVEVAEKSIKWLRLYGADVHLEAAAIAELTGGKDE